MNKVYGSLDLVRPVRAIAERQKQTACVLILTTWENDLETLKGTLTSLNGNIGLKIRLMTSWLDPPKKLGEDLPLLTTKSNALSTTQQYY